MEEQAYKNTTDVNEKIIRKTEKCYKIKISIMKDDVVFLINIIIIFINRIYKTAKMPVKHHLLLL